jgi:hypothetical protein
MNLPTIKATDYQDWRFRDLDGSDDEPESVRAARFARHCTAKLQAEIDALKAQNGQLQAALQAVIDSADYVDTGHQIAIDALAKLKGVSV